MIFHSIEEERKRRVNLEEWKQQHEGELQELSKDLKKASELAQKEKAVKEQLSKELAEIKDRLILKTMEMMQLKDQQQFGTSSPNSSPAGTPKEDAKSKR